MKRFFASCLFLFVLFFGLVACETAPTASKSDLLKLSDGSAIESVRLETKDLMGNNVTQLLGLHIPATGGPGNFVSVGQGASEGLVPRMITAALQSGGMVGSAVLLDAPRTNVNMKGGSPSASATAIARPAP